ncbi:hypothetical protein BCU84_00325 [Shewanella sp. 10N.286.51.B7]|nr:hypothetical protein BCU84_00325 [Shewanella sp. 10N.286.51.B7]
MFQEGVAVHTLLVWCGRSATTYIGRKAKISGVKLLEVIWDAVEKCIKVGFLQMSLSTLIISPLIKLFLNIKKASH